MSRTIEIRGLTDAQCDQLKAEAERNGLKFFDHCREKLLFGLVRGDPRAHARPAERPEPTKARSSEPDRIGRLEAMMAQMAETLNMLASNPMQGVAEHGIPEADNADIDVDDVIGQSLAVAEREGLTVVEREEPAQSGGVRHVGTRRPAPFSVNSVPHHLRNL